MTKYEIATVRLNSRCVCFPIIEESEAAIALLQSGYQLVSVYQADGDNYFVFQRAVEEKKEDRPPAPRPNGPRII